MNLVCLDEEGFMQDIERFTKQNIEVVVVEGFAPEPGERAEPIAMGRQTIWGGAGKPPSRDVMQAAAKAARTEMLTRVRESKGPGGNGGPNRGGGQRQAQGPRGGNGGGGARNGPDNGPRNAPRSAPQRDDGFPRDDDGPGRHEDQPPRSHDAHAARPRMGQDRMSSFPSEPRVPRAPGGQPDPMRTSVDLMAERGARRGGGYQGNRNGGGGGGGGYGGGGRGRGGPGGNRGPAGR